MNIKTIVTGYLKENCYLLIKDNNCLIIDPGDEAKKIISSVGSLNVLGILTTHNHEDHIGVLNEIAKHYHITKINTPVAGFPYELILTPGHTSDSKTFYFEDLNLMFVGDFIFYHSIGRMDLPTGSDKEMQESLNKISKYPDNTTIYPGHGPATTLGEEKQFFNQYF
jgi:glyoxylase-like metal-dependent hydrolase (beta-lactamase superfamily II)